MTVNHHGASGKNTVSANEHGRRLRQRSTPMATPTTERCIECHTPRTADFHGNRCRHCYNIYQQAYRLKHIERPYYHKTNPEVWRGWYQKRKRRKFAEKLGQTAQEECL